MDYCQVGWDCAVERELRPKGYAWRFGFRCPVKPEHGRSCTLIEGDDHRVVLYCGGGCSPENIAAAMNFPGKALARPDDDWDDTPAVVAKPTASAVTPSPVPVNATRVGLLDGAAFALGASQRVEAVWGRNSDVLWPEGEPVMIVAPDGTGKTSLGEQLALRRASIGGSELLGLPVAPSARHVLYIAADRPRQAARSMRRMVTEADAEALRAGLIVWRGALPFDLNREPTRLAAWAGELDADTVVIDSLKDVLAKLSEDDAGLAFNTAMQACAAAGVEVATLHHPRKAQAENKNPTALSDVYGSRWLTAACGSVVLLSGQAGDPVVQLLHVKPADETVGPWALIHDSATGATTVLDAPDLLVIVKRAGDATAKGVAESLHPNSKPKRSDVERARRKLEREVEAGHLLRIEPPGPNDPTVYRFVKATLTPETHDPHTTLTANGTPTPHATPSPLGGERGACPTSHVTASRSDDNHHAEGDTP